MSNAVLTSKVLTVSLMAGTASDQEFADGYRDGRDPDAPEPSANRSHAYRHSFGVGRAEAAGKPNIAAKSRIEAATAEEKDALA